MHQSTNLAFTNPGYGQPWIQTYNPANGPMMQQPPMATTMVMADDGQYYAVPQVTYMQQAPMATTMVMMTDNGQCYHPNLLVNFSYDCCTVVLVVILILESFPLAICACLVIAGAGFGFVGGSTDCDCCLSIAKNYRCDLCSYQQKRDRTGFYVFFGITQVVVLGLTAGLVAWIMITRQQSMAMREVIVPNNVTNSFDYGTSTTPFW